MVCRIIPVSVFSFYTMYYHGTQPGPYDLAVHPVSNTRLLEYGVLVPSGPRQAPIHGAGINPIPAGTQSLTLDDPGNFGMYPQPGMPGHDQENIRECIYTHDLATHVARSGGWMEAEGRRHRTVTHCRIQCTHRWQIRHSRTRRRRATHCTTFSTSRLHHRNTDLLEPVQGHSNCLERDGR